MKQTANYFAVLSQDDDMPQLVSDTTSGAIVRHKRSKLPTKSKVVAQSPETPPTSSCPLLERVPPELRLEIFELVLKAKHSLVNVGHLQPHKRGKKFSTALFRTCHAVFAEAEEVFYKINTMRVKSLNDSYESRVLLRNLEIAGDVARRLTLWPGSGWSNTSPSRMRELPHLKTLCLSMNHYDEEMPPLPPRAPVPTSEKEATKSSTAGRELRVLDYGVFEISKEFESDLECFMKRFRFIDAVAYARSLSRSTTLKDLETRYAARIDQRKSHFVEWSQSLFALRLACVEAWRTTKGLPDLDDSDQVLVDVFFLDATPPRLKDMLDGLIKRIPPETRLLDVSSDTHGHEVMEMASNVVRHFLPPPPRFFER